MPDWRQRAQCKDLTPQESDEIFFIGPGKSSKRARLYCQTCPVMKECSDFAVMYNECGIWAGSTDEDRRNLDPFISEVLRAQAEAEGRLESRNLNDFIPQVRHQHQLVDYQDSQIRREFEESSALLEAWAARAEERLGALVHPFDLPNAPQESAL